MTTIKDAKDRVYKLLNEDGRYTWLECLATGAVIQIASQHFAVCGFRGA